MNHTNSSALNLLMVAQFIQNAISSFTMINKALHELARGHLSELTSYQSPTSLFSNYKFPSNSSNLLYSIRKKFSTNLQGFLPYFMNYGIFVLYSLAALICMLPRKVPLGTAESDYHSASTEILKYEQLSKFTILDSTCFNNNKRTCGKFWFSN